MASFRTYLDGYTQGPDVTVNSMDDVHLDVVVGARISTDSRYQSFDAGQGRGVLVMGYDLTFDTKGMLTGGTVTEIRVFSETGPMLAVGQLSLPAQSVWGLLIGSTDTAFSTLLAGNDSFYGSVLDDLMRGYAGNDTMNGGLGVDSLFGGAGNDTIYGAYSATGEDDSSNFLRGEEGDDTLYGGSAFDDMHGNQGNDVLYGRGGDDWVVGGKGADRLYGDDGADIVYGNMGNDTLEGGAGADLVRGGQDDDVLNGGDGDDWLSGDKGSDTITGGAGADTFHSSAGAGLDLITDFSLAQGDRVVIDRGTVYSVYQSGADTVIDMGGDDRVVLAGVTLSSLSGDWLGVF